MNSRAMQAQGPVVLETAKQGPEAQDPKWAWVEASIWSERMLAALGNGVQGGTFFAEQGLFTLHEAHALASQSR
ncbi:MAG TPA: hypothetical protein VJ437_01065 [Acidiferrobacterales bacterium]|nr:hypothetical protein [Acidiferrobacterales bacterium]